ncbi:MAG: hypothetical protein WBE58_15070 [Verrucomicrobiales bacterium]|nr:hypothetical protein [Verrucomicrobiales bacterium]
MVGFDYLAKGIYGLSRAHLVSPMAGHLGAAVLAGYFIAEQHPDLDPIVYQGIEGELDRILGGESVFGPKKGSHPTVEELFAPVAAEKADPALIDPLALALSRNIDQTRESGHNVIFTAIAIRALHDHPDFATPSITTGLAKLIAGFDHAKPGSGYYGKERGRIDGRKVALPEEFPIPPYPDLTAMAVAVVDSLIRHAPERRDGFGGLWHLINHGAALAELSRYGYQKLALQGLPAHHQHLRLWSTVPDVTAEMGAETPTTSDPHSAEFWEQKTLRRDRARLDHRIKTLYGFDALLELVESPETRRLAEAKLRYLM